MNSILIANSALKNQNYLKDLVSSGDCETLDFASSGSEARRMVIDADYDLVIINTPLSDEFGHGFALYCADSTVSGVMLLVKSDLADSILERVEDFGIFVLEKPFHKPFFYQAVKLLEASRSRLLGLKNENVQLQKRIEEIRIIDRAKCVLMERLSLSEDQAYSYLKRHAMDMRVTKEKVARAVLATYGGTDPLKKGIDK